MRQIGEYVPETKSRYGLSWFINGGPPDNSVWTDLGDYWFITHRENVCYLPGDYYLVRKANILEYDFLHELLRS